MSARPLQILWPAFLMAGVLEMLIFAVVDPGELQWFGGAPIPWPRLAVYTVSFALCWAATASSAALTAMLLCKTCQLQIRRLP
jgi:hypothetical protein